MNLPSISPNLNTTINDHSAIDDSISQDGGLTIMASGNATINSNSGNDKASSGNIGKWSFSVMLQVLIVSVICDILICCVIMFNNNSNSEQVNAQMREMREDITDISRDTKTSINELKKTTQDALVESKKAVSESKEGTIWILRRDILNSIDYYTSAKTISVKQLKRIKDQFDYYRSIGGNHDVESRMTDFQTKIFGTGEIKVVSE